MDKITKREMYTAIAEGVKSGSFAYDVDDIVAFCNKEIDALDRKAAKAKERAASKAAEADALTGLVADALVADEFKTIADVAAIVAESDGDATVSKVTYRLGKLVNNGHEFTKLSTPAIQLSGITSKTSIKKSHRTEERKSHRENERSTDRKECKPHQPDMSLPEEQSVCNRA